MTGAASYFSALYDRTECSGHGCSSSYARKKCFNHNSQVIRITEIQIETYFGKKKLGDGTMSLISSVESKKSLLTFVNFSLLVISLILLGVQMFKC